MSEVFAILSGLFMIAVGIVYFKQVIQGTSTPNPATWSIWVLTTSLNTGTYLSVAEGDWFKTSTTLACAIQCVVVFLYALFKGKFGKLDKTEIICLVCSIIIGTLWRITGNAILANILLQLVFVISFIPTVVGVLKKELREKQLPWDLAVMSHTWLVVSIVASWHTGSVYELFYPIIGGILGNGAVSVAVRSTNKEVK
ncbi:hypothetical protein KKE14_03220 [Patescibacteria group bacterium]|nr:hypothetical protein [Patescibacteria group bacterium]